jgi:hypothetical protein
VGLKILALWQTKRPVPIDELPTSHFKRRRSDDVSSSSPCTTEYVECWL